MVFRLEQRGFIAIVLIIIIIIIIIIIVTTSVFTMCQALLLTGHMY